jgi:cell division septal protein FtsQ
LATGSTLAAYQVATYFGQASFFGLKAIEVDGLRRLDGADVRAASGLAAGTNIFAIDLDEIAQRLEAMHWIKQALVVRKPPDRIAVDIVEHRQVAWVDLGQTYGVAPDGVLLPVGSTGDRPVAPPRNLPVISGLSVTADSLRPGVAVPDSALLAILRWWEEAKVADAEFCLNVAGIQPMSGASIRLQMAGDGLEVRLPANEADRRLRTIRELMPRVHQNHPDPAYIDLRYAGQMVVGKKKAKSG